MAEFNFKTIQVSGSLLDEDSRQGSIVLAELVEGPLTTYLVVPRQFLTKVTTARMPTRLTGSLVDHHSVTFASSGSVTVD